MNEELLHFIWKYRLFDGSNLKTSDGVAVEVIHPGTHNSDAGPDFFNAKVKIGETLWAGNVEIHLKASDWYLHKHHENRAYNNVILHVVKDGDEVALTHNRHWVPTLQIDVSPRLIDKYRLLMADEKWLVCHEVIGTVNPLEFSNWLERCLVSRLEGRSQKIEQLLVEFGGDWDQVFFTVLARSFGFGTNAEPFELMARQTPFKVLMHHADDQVQVEALLLGQAGLLVGSPRDDYHKRLQREYRFLAEKFGLTPIDGSLWKFLRLRPMNFPTVRLVQLAAFVCRSQGLWGDLIKQTSCHAVMDRFGAAPSAYWLTHYLLGEESEPRIKEIGRSSRQLIVINAVVPFMFAYGAHRGHDEMKHMALQWLEELPAEKNHIVEGWTVYGGVRPANAFDTQALVYLRKEFCVLKKCLHCRIGLMYMAKREPS